MQQKDFYQFANYRDLKCHIAVYLEAVLERGIKGNVVAFQSSPKPSGSVVCILSDVKICGGKFTGLLLTKQK